MKQSAKSTGRRVRAMFAKSINEISWALRDYHNDQVKIFDPSVLDQLYALQANGAVDTGQCDQRLPVAHDQRGALRA